MEDLIEQANEIQESLGRSYAVPDEIDEADLEAGMFNQMSYPPLTLAYFVPELDALALEPPEEAGPSYLSDLNKMPDFIDEAPIDVGEVGKHFLFKDSILKGISDTQTRSRQDNGLTNTRFIPFLVYISNLNVLMMPMYTGLDPIRYYPYLRASSISANQSSVSLVSPGVAMLTIVDLLCVSVDEY